MKVRSTVQVSMSCELAYRVGDSRGSYEPQMTNVCLSVSKIEKKSKDMVMALGANSAVIHRATWNTGVLITSARHSNNICSDICARCKFLRIMCTDVHKKGGTMENELELELDDDGYPDRWTLETIRTLR
jgi:hypothetical protein